ncbi:unnamed protein product [Penicillium olsonii]|uniref:Uncharacterized protein n=1 Tax=Penicillium olsonii TaxID=99116 RepID=A0A9W4HQE9_PENOL|nr:unnamed protein product [Penicillium olsonii]CAG8159641.1 unnamed protein product [Penicillium olsonii]
MYCLGSRQREIFCVQLSSFPFTPTSEDCNFHYLPTSIYHTLSSICICFSRVSLLSQKDMPPGSRFKRKLDQGPKYKEERDTKKKQRAYCRDCGAFEESDHACYPICRRCSLRFIAGTGCDPMAYCGLFPCCGCCEPHAPSPESHLESPIDGVDYPVLKVLRQCSHTATHTDQEPPSQVLCPDLQAIMAQLCDFLLSDRPLEIKLDRQPYRAIFEAFRSQDSFIELAYSTVLPEIKALQGKLVTVDTLHTIRQQQLKQRDIWDQPHGGYLDFVTDLRSRTYWRPYIGQASVPKFQISAHHKNIQAGHQDSLHYWIIARGEQRVANFIRLWAIPFPPNALGLVKEAFENFLETVMCRAFHSLPPSALEELFGPCLDDEGRYSGMGLNVVSPLYQGKLGIPGLRAIIQQCDNLPDPDIWAWSALRKVNRKQQSKWSPSARHSFTKKDYYNILREATSGSLIGNHPFDINQCLPPEADLIPWGELDPKEPQDTGCWFKTTISNLQEQMTVLSTSEEDTPLDTSTPNEFIRPVGTSDVPIGIVFGCVPSHEYTTHHGSGSPVLHHLPWGLKESEFDESNSLIWSYNLQKFTLIPGGFQSRPPNLPMIRFLRTATKKLILGSKLRIIIMSGKEVEPVVLPDDNLISGHITLMLDDVECQAWVEHDGARILRLFVRSPSPLSELWASNGRMACQITRVFRLVSGLTSVKIHPAFFESTLVVTLIIRGWYDEKIGQITPVSPEDLDPLLRLWLAEKGFTGEKDLQCLTEAAGGSLRLGIQIICASHPNKAHRSKTAGLGVLPSANTNDCDHWPDEIFHRVQALFKEKAPLLFMNSERGQSTNEERNQATEDSSIARGIGLEPLFRKAQKTPGIPDYLTQFDEARTYIDGFQTNADASTTLDDNQSESIRLMLGSKHQGYRGKRAVGYYQFTIRHIGFSITTKLPPEGGFWIKAELSPIGKRHPRVWATEATLEDPGSRLAIRVGIRDSDDREIGFEYPSSDSWQACYKANRLVDELNGDSYLEISKRPRRHLFVDGRHKGLLKRYPGLKKYVGGAFNGHDGNLVRDTRYQRPRTSKSRRSDEKREGMKVSE